MSVEMTDTANKYANKDLPDGTGLFRVNGVEKKYGKNGGEFFIWKLQFKGGEGEQVLLPNMMSGLLKVLGCEEVEPNKFRWDTNEQDGKTFEATVSRKPDLKDPNKIRQHMGDFKAVQDDLIPF
jgi:hypothetical protein